GWGRRQCCERPMRPDWRAVSDKRPSVDAVGHRRRIEYFCLAVLVVAIPRYRAKCRSEPRTGWFDTTRLRLKPSLASNAPQAWSSPGALSPFNLLHVHWRVSAQHEQYSQ